MTTERIRVLVVDDDREDAELVEDLLDDVEMWEAETSWASTYETGVEAIREGWADVCLLDHRLGARSGIEFLEDPAVRASGVPVILMTGQGTAEIDRQAWEAGAADYLPKDGLTAPGLERAIRYTVERRRRRRVEARFAALVGGARELVSVLDEEGKLIYVSPSVSRVLGFDPPEKIGSPSVLEVHPDDRDEVRQALERVMADCEHVHHLQYRVRHADGSWRVLDTLAENHLDDPDIRGIVVSSWDVTERMEQQRRIRFQAELLDAVGQAVMATDVDGRIVYWNRAAERIYGWTEEEALGRDVVDVTPSDASRAYAAEIMEAMRKGDAWTGEFEVRRKDGSVFPALVTNSPITDAEGTLTGIVGVSSDIGELKLAQATMKERVKELRTLYLATEVLHQQEMPLDERLQLLVETLPSGWLYPEITEARLTLPGTTVETTSFRVTPWLLSVDVRAGDEVIGLLEVALTEERPDRDEGPFLKEERSLLETLARTVGEAVERSRLTRHLSQTISSLEEAVLVIDSRKGGGRIQSVNPAAERMFGYGAGEMVGQDVGLLHVSPDAHRRFREESVPALTERGVFRAAYPLRRKDGTVFDAEQTVSLLDPPQGMEGGVVSAIRDVSEAKRAESDLRVSEERFRQIAERIEDVFWISTDEKGGVEYVSPGYRKVWGRDPEELYEDTSAWADWVHPQDRERVLEAMAHQASGGYEEEYRIVRPDGEVRWIFDRAFPVRNEDGGVERIVGVAEDITERKAAEERLGVLSREISEVIYIVDPEGIVRFSTPSILQVAGYSRSEFEGTDALAAVHDEDRARVQARLDDILATPGATTRIQYRILHRDGQPRHVESVGRNLLENPGVKGILITTRDVTDRVELEQKLRQSQRLESIGRLAGGIAHDFNNLLTVIRSQTDLLLLDLDSTDPTVGEVEVIQAAADRAASLTNQLLAFSRDQVLRPRVVSLCDVVLSTAGLVQRVIGEDIVIDMEIPGGLPSVEVDPAQLEQVVLNLAINARDAMPRGGTLTLRTFRMDVDVETARTWETDPGAYTVLEVSDTGMGMDEETRTRAFEPFFTTKGKRGGTGLGLSMAYGFVRQSGGSMQVESVPREGTTFTLCFPAVDQEPEAGGQVPSPQMEEAPASGTVLVVEDDVSVRRVATKILRRAGLDVLEAENAENGLEILGAGQHVDVLVTDLGLPGMSGRELVDRVRESFPGLPVIVMSGYAADSPGHKSDIPAEIPFVQKPFTPEGLTRTVRRALRPD